jgi:YD repeat-containing protein
MDKFYFRFPKAPQDKWTAEMRTLAIELGYVNSSGGVNVQIHNALAHAYVSVKIAKEFALSKQLGDLREWWFGNKDPSDNFKDLWNNAVGRKIAAYAIANGLSDAEIKSLLSDALQRGELIVTASGANSDPRVPQTFSGKPSDFDGAQVSWNGPSDEWKTGFGRPLKSVPYVDSIRCFPGATLVAQPDGLSKRIDDLDIGEAVLTFNSYADGGRGALVSGVVTRLFENLTQEWLSIALPPDDGKPRRLVATPGHEMLRPEGGFARLDEMVRWDSSGAAPLRGEAGAQPSTGTVTLVDRDGSLITGAVERIVYSAATAHLFEQTTMLQGGGSHGTLALKPVEVTGWKTYNFEVSGTHTYIAEGVRVHNDSLPDDIEELYGDIWDRSRGYGVDRVDSDGRPVDGYFYDKFGNRIHLETVTDPNGDKRVVAEIRDLPPINDDSPSSFWQLKNGTRLAVSDPRYEDDVDDEDLAILESYDRIEDANGNVHYERRADSGQGVANNQPSTIENLAGLLGNQLGKLIATEIGADNVFAEIGISTLTGVALRNLAKVFEQGLTKGFDQVNLSQIFNPVSLGGQVFDGFSGAVGGYLSGLLLAEIADGLGLDGFEGRVFTTAGNAVISPIVGGIIKYIGIAAYNTAVGTAVPAFADFMGGIIGNINPLTALGSMIGSQLANNIITPTSTDAALFGSLASSVGALLGTAAGIAIGGALNFILPGIGALIGAFGGQYIGNYLGNQWFDTDALAYVSVMYDSAKGEFITTNPYVQDHGNFGAVYNVASTVKESVNSILQATGSIVDPDSQTGLQVAYYTNYRNWNYLVVGASQYFHQNLNAPQYGSDDTIFQTGSVHGVKTVLGQMNLIGGDVLLRRAFDISRAGSLSDLSFTLQIARDYRAYLDNPTLANAVMAADGDGAYAAGYLIMLQRAAELGLMNASANDFKGGIHRHLEADGLAAHLALTPVLDGVDPDKLYLVDEASGNYVTLNGFVPPGEVKTADGTTGNDTITFAADAKTYGVLQIDGGAGHDNLTGHQGTDIIVGGAGNDVIYGIAGHDWLVGGAGNDWLDGGEGDDILNGGDGDDGFAGGVGNDYIIGGRGNDTIYQWSFDQRDVIKAETHGASAQNDVLRIGWTPTAAVNAAAGQYGGLTLTRQGADLKISGGPWSTSGQLIIADFFMTRSGLDKIVFADNQELNGVDIWNVMLAGAQQISESFKNLDGTTNVVGIDAANQFSWASYSYDVTADGDIYSYFSSADDGSTHHYARDLMGIASYDSVREWFNASGELTYRLTVDDNGVWWDFNVAAGTETARNTDGNDVLTGTAEGEVIAGLGGSDTIDGGVGKDDLRGGGQADSLIGGLGNDRLEGDGDKDNDTDAGAFVFRFYKTALNRLPDAGGFSHWLGQAVNGTSLATIAVAFLSSPEFTYANPSLSNAQFVSLVFNRANGRSPTAQELASNVALLEAAINPLTRAELLVRILSADAAVDSHQVAAEAFMQGATWWNDTLRGDDGDDLLIGGIGADVLDGGAGRDAVSYADATGGVVVALAYPAANYGEASGDTFVGIEDIIGSRFNDWLDGDNAANKIIGGVGNDTIRGWGGNDTISAGYGDDSVDGGDGADEIAGGDGKDTLLGGSDNDTIDGGDDSDVIGGGDGDDSLLGATGMDSIAGHAGNDFVDGGGGNDLVAGDDGADSLYGDQGDDSVLGGAGADRLFGGLDDDTLDGGAGADALTGNGGFDFASYESAAASLYASMSLVDVYSQVWVEGYWGGGEYNSYWVEGHYEYALTGQVNPNSGDALGDTYADIEGLIGSQFNDTLRGNAAANVLRGMSGNDSLDGAEGDDTLIGGLGADVLNGGAGVDFADYSFGQSTVPNAPGLVVSLLSPQWNAAEALGDTFIGVEGVIGTDRADYIVGDGQANILVGGKGNDTLIGGEGADTASYRNSAAPVVVNLIAGVATSGSDTDQLSSIESADGGQFADHLIGNAGVNALTGLGGDDTLDGGAGADTLDGGVGFDFASYQGAATGVLASLTLSLGWWYTYFYYSPNTGDAAGDTYASIEGLIGSQFNDTLRGNADANELRGLNGDDNLEGLGGNDTLEGGLGSDTMQGGDGDDTIVVDGGDSIANISGGAGNDLLVAKGFEFYGANLLAAGFEGAAVRVVDDANTDWFRNYENTYNANWGLLRQTGVHDNGNSWTSIYDASGRLTTQAWVDTDDNEWFAHFTSTFNAAGQYVSVDHMGDDGTRIVNYYSNNVFTHQIYTDEASRNSWRTNRHDYNSAGQLTQTDTVYDNDERHVTTYDVASNVWYQNATNIYAPSGALLRQTGVHDNGNTWANVYDAAGRLITQTWVDANNDEWYAYFKSTFNAAGQYVSVDHMGDDGTRIVNYYSNNVFTHQIYTDEASRNPWRTNRFDYNSAGQLTQNYTVYDDGEQHTTVYDAAINAWYQNFTNIQSPSGVLLRQIGLADNGNTWVNVYDAAGRVTTQTWVDANNDEWFTQYTATYNATGQYVSVDHLGDDGTRIVNYYSNNVFTHNIYTDDSSIKPWWTSRNDYNSAGQITQKHTVYDDGEQHTTVYDVAANAWYQNFTNIQSPSGALLRQTGLADNGNTWANVYDAAGRVTTQTWVDANNDEWFAHFTSTFSPAGQYVSVDHMGDDGNRWINYYTDNVFTYQIGIDGGANESWETQRNDYDAQGRLDVQDTKYDDQSRVYRDFDQADAYAWNEHRVTFNAAGQIVQDLFL